MMKQRYIVYANQLPPDHTGESAHWDDWMRTKLGTTGYGRKQVWYKLADDSLGWKAKPGFGKLYFDYTYPSNWVNVPAVNTAATNILRDPHTVGLDRYDLDPTSTIIGHAWLVPDEGNLRPYFVVKAENVSALYAHIDSELHEQAEIHTHGDRAYVFPSYASGDEAAEFLREMAADDGVAPEDKPSQADIDAYVAEYDAFPTLARLRWA